MSAVIWRLPVFEELYSQSVMAKQGRIILVERGNYKLFASEALIALDSYDKRNTRRRRIISAQPSLSSSSLSTTSTTTTTTTTTSPVLSESKNTATTISVLRLTEEKEEQRSEILQSWEDVAHKVVKALSELI
jgi:hypothetical protein